MYLQSTSIQNPSAASTLPSDILQEIFLHCLPESPLDEVQPNTKIVPMLLCHICWTWRRAALSSPPLWLYLHYRLPIRWQNARPIAWDSTKFLSDMECLKWWRGNHGLKGPFIRFTFHQKETGINCQELPLTDDIVEFLVEYLSSAQYLDIDRFARFLFKQDTSEDKQHASCPNLPNLQSLVTSYPNNHEHQDLRILLLPHLMPFYIAPTLRRLRIHEIQLTRYHMNLNMFAYWSRLTHLSLHGTLILIGVWYPLIRGVPNLQWIYFNALLIRTNGHHNPPNFTLPYLSTFSVTIDSDPYEDKLDQLLKNLHFPAMFNLSIYPHADPWDLPSAAMRINNGLEHTPAISRLTLGPQFLGSMQHFGEPPMTNWESVEKLSTKAPHLTHLLLDMSYVQPLFDYTETLPERLAYWRMLLSHWLDLASPANTIRKISAILKMPFEHIPMVEACIRDALALDNKENAKQADKVVFEIVFQDKWGLSADAEGWKTWGSPL